jgi:hypothetical protein
LVFDTTSAARERPAIGASAGRSYAILPARLDPPFTRIGRIKSEERHCRTPKRRHKNVSIYHDFTPLRCRQLVTTQRSSQ